MTHFIPLTAVICIAKCYRLDREWQLREGLAADSVYFRFIAKLVQLAN